MSMVEDLLERIGRIERQVADLQSNGAIDADNLARALDGLKSGIDGVRAAAEEIVASERSLAEERMRYSELYNISPEIYLTTDACGLIQDTNPAAAAFFKRSPDALKGTYLEDLVSEGCLEDLRAHLAGMLRSRSEGGWLMWEMELRCDGTTVPVTASVAFAPAEGTSMALRWRIRDISDLRHLEEAYRSLVDKSIQGLLIIQDERVVFANKAASEMTGHTAEELMARTPDEFWEMIHPEDRELVRGRHMYRLRGRSIPGRYEFRGFKKDGSIIWVEMHASLIEYAGRPAVQVALVDITERMRGEEALRLYKLILERARDIIILLGKDGRIIEANEAAVIAYGRSRDELLSTNIRDLRAPSTIGDLAVQIETADRQGILFETKHLRKDGKAFPVEISARGALIGDERVILSIIRDITERKEAEAEIRNLKRAVETTPAAMVLSDLDGRVEYVNPGLMAMGGFSRLSEVLGRSVFDFTNEEGRAKIAEEIIPELYAQGQWRGEFPIVRRGGEVYTTEMICSLVRDDEGAPKGFLSNFYNITDRKMAEEALLLDESRLEALLKLSQMDFASVQEITDYALDAGVKLTGSKLGYLAFVDVDEATMFMHSWSAAAVKECDVSHRKMVYPLDETGLWGEALRLRRPIITNSYLSSPLRRGIPGGHPAIKRHMNVPIFDKGRIVAIAGAANKPVDYDESDVRQLTLMMDGMWRLIQHRKAEDALKESQRALSTLMANLPGAAYRCSNDPEWTMEFISDGCLALTGYSPQDIVANRTVSYADLIHPDDRDFVWSDIQDALAESRPFMLTYRLNTPAGIKWVWVQGRGIFSPEGEVIALEGFINDITERKIAEEALKRAHDELEKRVADRTSWLMRANEALHMEMMEHKYTEKELRRAQEAAEAANRAKSEFLANMSHEIRTPMNAVIGMAGLLLDMGLTHEQRDCIQTIRSSGDALLAIINDILDFSKIEGGKMEIEHRPFNLAASLEAAMDLIAGRAKEKGIDLAYILDEGVPLWVYGDVTRLRQVLINLVGNAVKFTEKGSVGVTVSRDDTSHVHFAVKDTGIGIAPDRMERLFQSFTQVDSSMTRRYGGTGLGLAISRRLVELMGGRIWAESISGQGSVFHFTIRAEEASPDEAGLSGRRILVVEEGNEVSDLVSSWGMVPVRASVDEAVDMISCAEPLDAAVIAGLPDPGEIAGKMEAAGLSVIALGAGEGGTNPEGLRRDLIRAIGDTPPQTKNGETSCRRGLRILVAEDNLVNQKVALLMLKKIGYTADVVGSGVEVLSALERRPYDVILMDIQMPDMDGLEAARAIRRNWPGAGQPKILAMTAYALKGDRERCLAAGMDGYITKPVQMGELASALDKLCRSLPK